MLRHNIQAYVKTQECAEQRPHASFYNNILIGGAKHAGKFYKQCDSSTYNIDMTNSTAQIPCVITLTIMLHSNRSEIML